MELECDLNAIKSEELLRKMWQQSEDVQRKKEIRSQLYKLRELRLKDLYQSDIMSGPTSGFGKDPLTPCHGDSLVDQSFQSLKSKEIRDSMSPTGDLRFQSMALNHPSNTGWDVQTSSEVTPDGRAFRSETVAKTDGVEKINGGLAEFKGRNEQRSSGSHEGDDKNYVKKASESSNTHLQEKVVIGDENSGRTEMKMTSTSSSSSSQVVQSSSTTEYDGQPLASSVDRRYLTDNAHNQQRINEQQQYNQQHRQIQEHQQQQQYRQQQEQQHTQHSEEYKRHHHEQSTSTNVETQQLHEQSKRLIDVDKASPEYQRHVQQLMSQPGEIISNTVEYPKPNVKMITTVKRLPDGTIVKNKRYETEELTPATDRTHHRQTNTKNTNQQYVNDRRTSDVVDNAERFTQTHGRPNNQNTELTHRAPPTDVDQEIKSSSYSSVKKSSSRYSTESTSETIQEYDDRAPYQGPKGKPQDFSTHGFPSVRSNKPTQEYPSSRPQTARPTQDFSTHGFPSVRPNKPTQEYPTDRPQPIVQTITTQDGDVIKVSSETTRSYKQKTNSERTTETEVITDGGEYPRPIDSRHPEKITQGGQPSYTAPLVEFPNSPQVGARPSQDFTTHGFPSVRTPGQPEVILVSSQKMQTAKHNTNSERIIETEVVNEDNNATRRTEDFSTHGFPSVREPQGPARQGTPTYAGGPRPSYEPTEDFSTNGFPSVRSPTKDSTTSNRTITHPIRTTDGEVIVVSSEKHHSSKYNTNNERIIETEIVGPHDHHPHGSPNKEYPASPRRSQPSEDFSTHGFPSVRSPTKPGSKPDFSTHGFPSAREPTKPKGTSPTRNGPRPSTTTTTTTTTKRTPSKPVEATKTLLHKEKETDAAHRAFAASLRCSSPSDYTDSQRHTPSRTSVASSNRTFRREGSHDSASPSETSRISSTTVTRQSPTKPVGKTTPTLTKQVTTNTYRNRNGSSDTIDLTPKTRTSTTTTKTPNGKAVTTTTTTTTTRKIPAADVPKTDNQITTSTTRKSQKTSYYPINKVPSRIPSSTTPKPKQQQQQLKQQLQQRQQLQKPKSKIQQQQQQARQFKQDQALTIPPQPPRTNTNITKKTISTNEAHIPQGMVEAIIEEPICLKKNYYKLGANEKTPSQANEPLKVHTTSPTTTTTTTTTSQDLEQSIYDDFEHGKPSTSTSGSVSLSPSKPHKGSTTKHVTFYGEHDDGFDMHGLS